MRARVLELVAAGESCTEAARQVGANARSVVRWANLAGMELQPGRIGGIAAVSEFRRRPRLRHPRVLPEGDHLDENGRLTLAGRVVIAIRLRERWRHAAIARELGVHRSTVKREVDAGSVDGRYRCRIAQRRAEERRRRPKPDRVKIRPGTELWDELIVRLNNKQSPEQISGRLARDFAGRDDMQVSHETIYQALYVQGAGALRHELGVEKALRSGRTTRRPRSKLGPRSNRSWIGEATITARPAEADDRAVPGHWEGDLIIGGDLRSALITLFERNTRFCLISRLTVHDTATVTDRLTQMAGRLPAALWRSLTWDQGVEMADHAKFTTVTDCPVFFCDPHSPWQRPTNENGNGLLREFFPKGTDFTTITDHQVLEAERLLNTRPRKILDFATPAEKLDQLLTVATNT
ncbi:IS30 family transposase [Microlunatus sp. GCM10028923]|uniref:IS30 family transposase n=1 Tax=Microlunatus sp. GCM10028923 TaxID=3273400 RepID=UPI003608BE34